MDISVLAINCTLKRGTSQSSTDKLLKQVTAAYETQGASCEMIRAVNHHIPPGIQSNEGEGDEWPAIRKKILASDILLIGTPIWMGHASSIAQRLLERMDAFLEEKDAQGRMHSFGKVAAVAVVGNEDGAHHVSASLFQGLNDVGFTIPAAAVTYWVGEAMGDKDYVDLPHTPRKVTEATETLVRHSLHLAKLLKAATYPA